MPLIAPPEGWALIRKEALATGRIALPIVGGQLAYTGLAVIDTLMAGRLSPATLGAIGVGNGAWVAFQLFAFGVMMAVPPTVAQLSGADRRAEVGAFARQAFWVALSMATFVTVVAWNYRPVLTWMGVQPELVPTVVGYLRALTWGTPALFTFLLLRFVCEGLGETRPVLYFGLLSLPVNVVANALLMYGMLGLPALGAVGCGYATAVVWWAQCLGLAFYMSRRRIYRELRLFIRPERPRWEPIREMLVLGVPIGVAIFMEAGLFSATALLIGSLGTIPIAGHQVALNFAAVTFMVPLGVAMAITVRVGNAAGRRDQPAARRAAGVGIALALACQVVAASLMLLIPETIARFYTKEPAVIAMAVRLLFLAALFQISDGLQAATAGALRGLKDTRVTMFLTLVAYWVVGFPTGYFLAFVAGLGARGMWMGLIAGLSAAACGLVFRLRTALARVGEAEGAGGAGGAEGARAAGGA